MTALAALRPACLAMIAALGLACMSARAALGLACLAELAAVDCHHTTASRCRLMLLASSTLKESAQYSPSFVRAQSGSPRLCEVFIYTEMYTLFVPSVVRAERFRTPSALRAERFRVPSIVRAQRCMHCLFQAYCRHPTIKVVFGLTSSNHERFNTFDHLGKSQVTTLR